MKNKLIASVCALTATLIFVACGNSEKSVDLNATADKLIETAGYEDELIKADPSAVEKIYFIDENIASEMVVYMSSNNSTPEEIALFKAADSDAAKKLKSAVDGRLEELKISFENYAPDELYKIENAVVKASGNYVFMTVCPDNQAAEKELSNAFK